MEDITKESEIDSLLKKGTEEWRNACGLSNRDNGYAIKHGKYVQKPDKCSESCKLAKKGCRYFEECYGKKCMFRAIEEKEIEDIAKVRKRFVETKICRAMKFLEVKEDMDVHEGTFYLADSANEVDHILSLLDKLEKFQKKKISHTSQKI